MMSQISDVNIFQSFNIA